ncbi:hypothetical protein B0H34DRAFT_657094 [Crassisporium funariophilum]|nr:hypothetical protein B0H34DRAFT_657094 [Crassisporium funariophilum]
MLHQTALQSDPNNSVCPDFTSEIYANLRQIHISEYPGTTEADAVQHLQSSWRIINEADKTAWLSQQALNIENAAELQRRLELDAETAAEKVKSDLEAIRQEDMKKHKAKYLPILDRDVPDQPPILASATALRKLTSGGYFELYYWTNAGLTDAKSMVATTDDDALSFVMQDGATSLVSTAATRDSRGVKADKDLSWDDFCIATPRVVEAMERAGWQREKTQMFAQFWANLRNHQHASAFDSDGLLRKSLLTYQDEVRRSWFTAVASGNTQATFNIARINETLLLTVQRRVEYEYRAAFDKDFFMRVSIFSPALLKSPH